MVAGGSVLAWIGFGTLCGAPAGSQPSSDNAAEEVVAYAAILFAAILERSPVS